MPAILSAVQSSIRTIANPRRDWRIALIVASGLFCTLARAADPPPDLARRVARKETQSEAERANFTYRQSLTVEEISSRGAKAGEYREVREVIFSPGGERTERFAEKPFDTLKRLRLTEEDFRDIREVQPLLFTSDRAWLY